jgi:hypothetical protein
LWHIVFDIEPLKVIAVRKQETFVDGFFHHHRGDRRGYDSLPVDMTLRFSWHEELPGRRISRMT